MSEFKIPPISTLSGSTFVNYWKAIRSGRVEAAYFHKVLLTGLVCGFSSPFHLWERLQEIKNFSIQKPPLFIIGHWRSGTTFLHNLLCQDPNAGYVSTYQSLFPNNMKSQTIFKSFMKMNMPDKRPSDNVRLDIDFPQEDEFALGNIQRLSFYDIFFFPDRFDELFDQTVEFKNVSTQTVDNWKLAYEKLIAKALTHGGRDYAILKNPVNTARTDQLLEVFPQAKFLHIYRNPVIVYLSIKKFFLSLYPTLQFQKTTPAQIIDMIMKLYVRLMRTYLEKRKNIPASQLLELRFEDFEKDPMGRTKEVYQTLKFSDWGQARPKLKAYLEQQKAYQKNSYEISRSELDRVVKEWGFAFEAFDYDIPKGLKVI